MSQNLEGGCSCGDVRYEILGEPVLQLFCFCSDCRSTTGSDAWPGYMVKETDFCVIKGSPSVYKRVSKEGRVVKQNFCGNCGSTLWGETEFGLVSVGAGSLDDPAVFSPTKKVFLSGAPHWARVPSDLQEM